MTPTTQLSKVSNIKGLRPYYRVNYILTPTEKDAYDDTEINLSIYTEDAEEAYDYDHQLYARKVDEIPGLDGDLEEIVEAYGRYALVLDSVEEFYNFDDDKIYQYLLSVD